MLYIFSLILLHVIAANTKRSDYVMTQARTEARAVVILRLDFKNLSFARSQNPIHKKKLPGPE